MGNSLCIKKPKEELEPSPAAPTDNIPQSQQKGSLTTATTTPAFQAPPRQEIPRQELLDTLSRALEKCSQGNNPADRILVLTGPEGVGKTHIVNTLMKAQRKNFDHIHLIEDCQLENIISYFDSLATIEEENQEQQNNGKGENGEQGKQILERIQRIYERIEKEKSRELFILEDAQYWIEDEDHMGLCHFLPQEKTSNLPTFLVTSTNDDFGVEHNLNRIKIPPCSAAEAVVFLREIFHIQSHRENNEEEAAGASQQTKCLLELAESLNGHPMAVAMAASVVQHEPGLRSKPLEEQVRTYLERVKNNQSQESIIVNNNNNLALCSSVVDISLENLKQEKGALEILKILSYLKRVRPEHILSLVESIYFTKIPTRETFPLSNLNSSFEFFKNFELLLKYNFISISTDSVQDGGEKCVLIHVSAWVQKLVRGKLGVDKDYWGLEKVCKFLEFLFTRAEHKKYMDLAAVCLGALLEIEPEEQTMGTLHSCVVLYWKKLLATGVFYDGVYPSETDVRILGHKDLPLHDCTLLMMGLTPWIRGDCSKMMELMSKMRTLSNTYIGDNQWVLYVGLMMIDFFPKLHINLVKDMFCSFLRWYLDLVMERTDSLYDFHALLGFVKEFEAKERTHPGFFPTDLLAKLCVQTYHRVREDQRDEYLRAIGCMMSTCGQEFVKEMAKEGANELLAKVPHPPPAVSQ